MVDLVERLNKYAETVAFGSDLREAAEAIERLEAELTEAQSEATAAWEVLDRERKQLAEARAENERKDKALKLIDQKTADCGRIHKLEHVRNEIGNYARKRDAIKRTVINAGDIAREALAAPAPELPACTRCKGEGVEPHGPLSNLVVTCERCHGSRIEPVPASEPETLYDCEICGGQVDLTNPQKPTVQMPKNWETRRKSTTEREAERRVFPQPTEAKYPHDYPGDPAKNDGDCWTSSCSYGCGAWAGPTRSGAPEGIAPFGCCPKHPAAQQQALESGDAG